MDVESASPVLSDRMSTAEDDYLTVELLASGLAAILRQRGGISWGTEVVGLLPDAWRVGFSRLWWRFTEQGVVAPQSDLELLRLCAQPMASWPVELALSQSDLWNALLAGEELSSFAEQAARLGCRDVEAEWAENRVHQALRRAAEENGGDPAGSERAYARLRRFLIDHPVVADLDVARLEREYGKADNSGQTFVRTLINAAYNSRTAAGAFEYLRCPGCGNTLSHKSEACGTAGCPGGAAQRASTRALAVVFEHHRATRRFVHDPGLVECRIFDALAGCEELSGVVRTTLYPAVDALDVLIEFLEPASDGSVARTVETWGVDAKDQASARLLGRGFTWPQYPACDRRFLALPAHRADQPGYVGDLEAELEGRVEVSVIEERRLTQRVKAHARGLSR
jgi:hypothetical protein